MFDLGVVHKWRHVILDPLSPISMLFSNKALLLSSENFWPLPKIITSFKDDP